MNAESQGFVDTPQKKQVFTSESLLVIVLCFVFSLLYLLVCTKSSPLYPFNDWVDVNAFFTVGKGMMHGLVPYRDLFEQKGLLLYFVYGLAILVPGYAQARISNMMPFAFAPTGFIVNLVILVCVVFQPIKTAEQNPIKLTNS